MNIFSKIQKFKNEALIDDKQSFTYNDVLKKLTTKAYINSKKLNFLICENSVIVLLYISD